MSSRKYDAHGEGYDPRNGKQHQRTYPHQRRDGTAGIRKASRACLALGRAMLHNSPYTEDRRLSQQQVRWPPTREQVLGAVVIAAALLLISLFAIRLNGYNSLRIHRLLL